jgi:tetratricopeptide (TPR) repeat protein
MRQTLILVMTEVFTWNPWTGVPPGTGPPQPRIASRVREAGLVIICFWARLGISPGGDSHYTSGTEEEFYEALDARERNGGTRPEIWLSFGDVPAQQLADPGLQLTKVREFQGNAEKERLVLYKTYRDLEYRVRQLQDYLRTWLREGGPGHTVTAEPSSPTEPRDSAQMLAHIDELRQALKEAKQAQVKLRQAALQSAIAALTAHSRGDLLSAETSYAQALDLDYPFPESHFQRALELLDEYPTAHYNYAILLVDTSRPQDAETHYLRALELDPELVQHGEEPGPDG